MGITINISDSATGPRQASNSTATVMPLDAGASVALASTDTPEPAAHVHAGNQVLNGGAPPASLVQEIDAALGVAASASQTSSLVDGVSAGAAPVQ